MTATEPVTATYTAAAVARAAGVSRARLGMWEGRGLLALEDAGREGVRRRLSLADALAVSLTASLARLGLPPRHVRLIVEAARRHFGPAERGDPSWLIVRVDEYGLPEWHATSGTDDVMRMLLPKFVAGPEVALVIDVRAAYTKLRRQLAPAKKEA